MKALASLPIVASSDPDLSRLYGQPAWPYRSEKDRERLTQIARLFGCEVREPQAGGSAVGAQGTVAALGSAAARPAELYAHLTGRKVAYVVRPDELNELADLEVVLTLREEVSPPLLEGLWSVRRPSLPGLIFGPDTRDLHDQAILRSAAARLRGDSAAT